MRNLKDYTVKEFATLINENAEYLKDLMLNSKSISYTNKPYKNLCDMVEISKIKAENKDIVVDYIYASLYNRPAHRTYSTRGYSVTLR